MPAIYFSGTEIHALLVLHELVARMQPSVLKEELEPLKKLLRKLVHVVVDLAIPKFQPFPRIWKQTAAVGESRFEFCDSPRKV